MYKYFPGLQLKVLQFTLSLHVLLSLVGGFYITCTVHVSCHHAQQTKQR